MKNTLKKIGWGVASVVVLALIALIAASNVSNQPDPQDQIAASGNHAMVIRNGQVRSTGRSVSFPGLAEITNAKQIDANGFLVIIDENGKLHSNSVENEEIAKWENVKKVTVGYDFVIGLKQDGTLIAAGGKEFGQTAVTKARDVKKVSAGAYHYAGITKSGEVFKGGSNEHGECNIKEWTDIKDIECGPYATVGLKKNGTVVSTIPSSATYDLSGFTNIKKVVTSKDHTVGLRKNGTVVATGNNEFGQCNVSDWTDIIAIKANKNQTVGLKADGTVVATGDNQYGQCDAAVLNQ